MSLVCASMENEVGAHVGSARKFLINFWVQINLVGRAQNTSFCGGNFELV